MTEPDNAAISISTEENLYMTFSSKLVSLEDTVHEVESECMNAGILNPEERLKNWQNTIDAVGELLDKWAIFNLRNRNNHLDYPDLNEKEAENATTRKSTLRNLVKKKVRSVIASSHPPPSYCLKIDDYFSSRLLRQLDNNVKDANLFFEALQSSSAHSESRSSAHSVLLITGRPNTSAWFLDSKLVGGIENDRDKLLELLMPLTNGIRGSTSQNEGRIEGNGVKVITIVGVGGSGKTTLAELLYDDDEVKKYFELRKWVCMSQILDPQGIATAILGNSGQSEGDSILSLESLYQIIRDTFSMKKFLLILDDVCIQYSSTWQPFRDALKYGSPGSIILVTTSSSSVASTIGTHQPYEPTQLTEEESWLLFKETALFGRSDRKLESVGKEIARKCNRVPLNIQIIASLLRFKTTLHEWREIRDSSIWKDPELNKMGFCPISISYYYLLLRQKCCLLYTAKVFPNDAIISKDRLIRLWMAEGYLGQVHTKKIEMGLEVLEVLAMLGFFHKSIKGSIHKNEITGYNMHNLVHRFARHRASIESFDKRRKSSLVVNQDLFKKWEFVKALDLSSCKLPALPEEVGWLILVRYLNLSGNPLKQLPDSICDLYNLEFLDVHSCHLLLELPSRIGELLNLRHLRVKHTTATLQHLPPGFKELSSILTLDVFRVGGRYNGIAMLKDFDDIREICIAIHGEVKFTDAKLENKKDMENLELCFVGEGQNLETVSALNSLHPPKNLQMLKFEGYVGLRLPQWIVANEGLIKKLRRLTLRSALNLLCLPALGKLSTLEFLWLYDIPNLKHLGREFFGLPDYSKPSAEITETDEPIVVFPSLKTLRIEYLENWETWEVFDEYDKVQMDRISVMPQLEELVIRNCGKLQKIPDLICEKMPSLKVSDINGNQKLQLQSDNKGGDGHSS